MLKLNGKTVKTEKFFDGTLRLKQELPVSRGLATIDWRYEHDGEMFVLQCLTRHLQEAGFEVDLFLPYVPNARMDRVRNAEDVFTLKYFAEFINWLRFNHVIVLDPHSAVSEALIARAKVLQPQKYIKETITRVKQSEKFLVFFPDDGALKRYSDMVGVPYACGAKHRYWETGKLAGLKVVDGDDHIEGNDVLIIDDICSRGGTFMMATKALKDLGANDIYLFVTHCENTILKGEIPASDLIKKVYTTDSVYTVNHKKVEVLNL